MCKRTWHLVVASSSHLLATPDITESLVLGEMGDWKIITTGTTKLRGKGPQEPRSPVLPPAPAEGV